MVKKKYDIVIIGAGIGGLVSAALLVDSGKKILIIEKEPKPGGYLTEFKNEGFSFDVSLHLLNSCSEGQYVHNMLKKCGVIDEIKFLKPKYLYRSIFPDFDVNIPQTNLEKYKEILKDISPESAKGIDLLCDEGVKIYEAVNHQKESNCISPLLMPYLRNNCDEMINKYIKDVKLKALIAQLWIYFGLPPKMLRAVDFCYPTFDYMMKGGYYVEKGSYAIVKALVNYIRNKGGDFLFNKNVGRISVENNVCKKVAFGKDEIFCDTIISNIDLTKTTYELIGSSAFSQASIKRLKSMEPSISAFEVFLGLDVDLKEHYPDDYEIFVNSEYDLEKQYEDCIHSNAKKAPFVMTINSNVNKFSAPIGKSVVTIVMLSGYDYWIAKSKGEYQDKKQRIADILIKRARKVLPEIGSNIIKKVVSTPVTFERYTNNTKGAIYGYSRTTNEKAEINPHSIAKIDNLYFASAWVKQGSGVAKVMRSAEEVAKKILSNK